MNHGTDTVTGRPVGATELYDFAAFAASVNPERLGDPITDPAVERVLRRLFPDLTRPQLDRLWDRASVNAAALHQLEWNVDGWPLSDMDPPRSRLSARFDGLLRDLERAVEADIREARGWDGPR